MEISGKNLSNEDPCIIIAEVGSNHDGDLDKARALIKAAAQSGADVVKFQSLSADGLISKKRLVNGAWENNPVYDAVKKLELPKKWYPELIACCQNEGVIFLSTPFDEEMVFLLDSLRVAAFKIASGDLTNIPLMKIMAKLKKPLIISTGAATMDEVGTAVKICETEGNQKLVLLHCVSSYPSKLEDANIRAVNTLQRFGYPVGYSDHTSGWTVPLGAVALGAKVIEKHITFDRSLIGPDHGYALTVEEFSIMVREIRSLEAALGNGEKKPVEAEISERVGARRSIYANVPISEDTVIEKSMLKVVRHAYGIPPYELDKLIGCRTKRMVNADEALQWEDIV